MLFTNYTCSIILYGFGMFIPDTVCTVMWDEADKIVLQCNVKSDKLVEQDNGPWMQRVTPEYIEENCEKYTDNTRSAGN